MKQFGLPSSSTFCEICTLSKLCTTPVSKDAIKRESQAMGMSHTDIIWPIEYKTFSGEEYFMTLIGD